MFAIKLILSAVWVVLMSVWTLQSIADGMREAKADPKRCAWCTEEYTGLGRFCSHDCELNHRAHYV